MKEDNPEQVKYVLTQTEKYEKSLILQKKKWLVQKCYFLKYEIKQRDLQITEINKNARIELSRALGKADTDKRRALKKKDIEADKLKNTIHQLRERVKTFKWRKQNFVNLSKMKKVTKSKLQLDIEELKVKVSPYREILKERLLGFLLTYAFLEKEGIVEYNEFMLLSIGAKLGTFNRDDIKDQMKGLKRHPKAAIMALIDAGYLRKIYRKQVWYITVPGQERLNNILEHIEQKEIEFYHGKTNGYKRSGRKLSVVNN